MRIYDIIEKKRDGHELTPEELSYVVSGAVSGEIPDYQLSALLMAIYFNGMTGEELNALTRDMMYSGDVLDLSAFGDRTADKHSTGGVGDKTTLIVAPIAASLGCVIAKMSGRGLGFTGGTVDKLESIPGYRTSLEPGEFMAQLESVGIAVVGQSGRLAPADKKLYALRDVTATIESIPLIASSIMSKKLASGAKNIVLDVKIGSGAFLKNESSGRALAETMVSIGRAFGRRVSAVISNMDRPLGYAVGNALEIREAVELLAGEGEGDLYNLCVELASQMAALTLCWSEAHSRKMVCDAISSGKALAKFREWITAQGGDASFIDAPASLCPAKYNAVYRADKEGFITHMDAELVGKAACVLGAGRERAGESVDPSAGIKLRLKTGEYCRRGDVVAELFTSDEARLKPALDILSHCIADYSERPYLRTLIIDTVT